MAVHYCGHAFLKQENSTVHFWKRKSHSNTKDHTDVKNAHFCDWTFNKCHGDSCYKVNSRPVPNSGLIKEDRLITCFRPMMLTVPVLRGTEGS